MSVTFTIESENIFVVRLKGILTFEDFEEVQNKARAEIDRSRKVKILILAEEFSGWGKKGDWGDVTFMLEHDPYIEKIAVVSPARWKDEIFMFMGGGMRRVAIEFFLEGAEKDARDWLQGERE